jgi:hypothetical protein
VSVYVDNMRASYGRMVMCHMIADSTDELLAMADAIGVQRKWLQKPGTHWEHFDICLSKRNIALGRGAIELTTRQLGMKLRDKRQGSPHV